MKVIEEQFVGFQFTYHQLSCLEKLPKTHKDFTGLKKKQISNPGTNKMYCIYYIP